MGIVHAERREMLFVRFTTKATPLTHKIDRGDNAINSTGPNTGIQF